MTTVRERSVPGVKRGASVVVEGGEVRSERDTGSVVPDEVVDVDDGVAEFNTVGEVTEKRKKAKERNEVTEKRKKAKERNEVTEKRKKAKERNGEETAL
ncbi:hypothetical protein RHMOL_Rhmol06G0112800 [Rhododendron molle]|uniref:Uncharacterized protein n=1 Tax=Rhododendron molle TaxID=49168 RepID=A0ACC0NBC0_RHOML|nr:hypothetical protein RHMOL_Rhmol06G0112800 [Rhododendron molle]